MVLQRVPSNVPVSLGQEAESSRTSSISHKSTLSSSVAAAARRRRLKRALTGEKLKADDSSSQRIRALSPALKAEYQSFRPPPIESPPAGESSGQIITKRASVAIPRRLARPAIRNIDPATVAAIEPELADTPVQYIREVLQEAGPSMLAILTSISAAPVETTFPKEIDITVTDLSADMPTHMLAVHRDLLPSDNGRKRVTLLPIHAIILSAYCANLPALPPSKPLTPEVTNSIITLPVIPLRIPSPETFPHLCTYIYTKRADRLLLYLLPIPPNPTGSDSESFKIALQQLTEKLAVEHAMHQLIKSAVIVNGVWRNVCALGISDDKLWTTMNVAWEVLLAAITIKTRSSSSSSVMRPIS